MNVYAWTADSAKVRASECNATECVGWDISLVGGARFRSGTSWPANQIIWPMRDGSRLLRLTEAGLQLDLLNGAPARVLAPAVRTASLTADGRRVLFTKDGSALQSLSIETGQSETVFTPDNKQKITEAMELADHRVLVLLSRPNDRGNQGAGPEARLWELTTDATGRAIGPPRQITEEYQKHQRSECINGRSQGRVPSSRLSDRRVCGRFRSQTWFDDIAEASDAGRPGRRAHGVDT